MIASTLAHMRYLFSSRSGRNERQSDFSDFFNHASSRAQKKLLGRVLDRANESQRKVIEQYERAHKGLGR